MRRTNRGKRKSPLSRALLQIYVHEVRGGNAVAPPLALCFELTVASQIKIAVYKNA